MWGESDTRLIGLTTRTKLETTHAHDRENCLRAELRLHSQKTTFDVKLADADSESLGSLPVRIEASDFCISIFPQGHGDFGLEDGHGCPLFLELYQGRLRVIAFPNINNEDLQIIDLSSAREDTHLNDEVRTEP